MRKLSTLYTLLLTAACSPGLGHAVDLKAGQTLHDAHCVKCHGSEVYTRADHRVTSLEGLRQQVQRCDANLELGWFDEELDNVSQYLNATYYKFK
jgi:mono/diheme cytochrome c family protein